MKSIFPFSRFAERFVKRKNDKENVFTTANFHVEINAVLFAINEKTTV